MVIGGLKENESKQIRNTRAAQCFPSVIAPDRIHLRLLMKNYVKDLLVKSSKNTSQSHIWEPVKHQSGSFLRKQLRLLPNMGQSIQE